MGETGQEVAIEVSHAKQLGRGRQELMDGSYLLRKGADPLRVNPVTEERHHGLGYHAFLHVNCHVVLVEVGEDLPEEVLDGKTLPLGGCLQGVSQRFFIQVTFYAKNALMY